MKMTGVKEVLEELGYLGMDANKISRKEVETETRDEEGSWTGAGWWTGPRNVSG
jgi:hypothetical protein